MNRPLLLYITMFIESIVAVWALFRWKHSAVQQRLVSLLLVATTVSAITELWMGLYHIRNLWVSQIFTLIEYVLILSMYYLWKPPKTDKRILMIGIIAFIALWTVSKFTFEPFYRDDTYTSAIAKTIEIITSAWVLFDVLGDSNAVVKTDARVWISSGIIIYASGTLFLFALFNLMLDTSPELIKTLWPINWILTIVFTLLLARGVWCRVTL
jgi:hypothetical protein